MSWETQCWASKQRPGSSSAKLVLLGLASCANSDHEAYPSIQWLCDFGDLNRKTVIASLQKLEGGMFPLIIDTGRRRGRTNQVKVYRLAAGEAGIAGDPEIQTGPKAEQSQKRNSSAFSRKESQKRDTEPVLNHIPPISAKADMSPQAVLDEGFGEGQGAAESQPDAPKAKATRKPAAGTRLPADWTPPAVADLPPLAAGLVREWPAGAYEATCEGFRLYWTNETRRGASKRDWTAALATWLMKDHGKVMRDAKAGISYASAVAPAAAKSSRPAKAVPSKARENDRSARVHELLRKAVGQATYDQWLAPVAILCDDTRVVVITASEFQRSQLEEHWRLEVMDAARQVIGARFDGVRFQTEQQAAKGLVYA